MGLYGTESKGFETLQRYILSRHTVHFFWKGCLKANGEQKGERRIGALTAIKARAPVLGGNFGVWGGLFSTYDCAMKGIRKKEDPWNASTLLHILHSLARYGS